MKHEMKHEDIPVDKIKIGNRHRIERGDIDGLAANIGELGLLQPIGVDRYYQLIFGERRLEACKCVLNWKTIPAVVLDIDSLIAGEYAENQFRKDFTPIERAAIGEAILKELGNRHGGDRSTAAIAALEKGKSADIAAKRAGFKSAETFERVKTVAAKGAPELIAAMEAGKLSVDAAAKIASQPKDEQQRIVEMPKEEQREIVKQIRQTKADKESVEGRAYDVRVFRGLAEHVEQVANHHIEAKATWEGLTRVSAYNFSEHLTRAIACLVRLEKAHPNEPRKPGLVPRGRTGSGTDGAA
jgi:ParB/RepB/Spo0J family partition protein